MKKIIPIILVLLCFSCDRKYGIYNFDVFEKDGIYIPIPEHSRELSLKNDILFYTNRERTILTSYNLEQKKTDTLDSICNQIWSIFPLNDTSVFYNHCPRYNLNFCLSNYSPSKSNYNYLQNVKDYVTHPYWGKNYECNACLHGLSMVNEKKGVIKCYERYCFFNDYTLLIRKNIPIFLIFEIGADNNIKPVSFFGWYPKNHPANIYYNQGWLYHYYNSSTNQYICYTLIDNYIVLCDSMGRREKDVYFGSKFYKEYPPFGYEDLHSTSAVIYSYENFIAYSCLAYDPYREVYLRVIKLPRQPKNEEVFKEKVMDFAIIVADKNFNIKYEVFFDGTKYKCLYDNFLINKKGVLIFKETKYDTNTEVKDNATWFIFD